MPESLFLYLFKSDFLIHETLSPFDYGSVPVICIVYGIHVNSCSLIN